MTLTDKTKISNDKQIMVSRNNISGTKIWIYTAWQKVENSSHDYSTITFLENQKYGKIGTKDFTEKEFHEAYGLILAYFPESDNGELRSGCIELISE